MTTIFAPSRFSELSSFELNFRGTGISGTATANTTTNIDYQLTEDRIITGGFLILQNHQFGDYVSFQVVDKDNILGYGAGTVLNEFMTNWYVASDTQIQKGTEASYPAKVFQGLYLRIIYHSTALLGNVNVRANFNMHKVLK